MKHSGILFLLSFVLVVSSSAYAMKQQHTPPSSPRSKKARTAPVTPQKITTDVRNYCREFIQALGSKNLNSANQILVDFMNKIPYSMHFKDHEFYQALLCLICTSLSNKSPFFHEQTGTVITALEHQDFVLVLECGIIESEPITKVCPTFTYSIDNCTKPIIPLGIIFFIPNNDSRGQIRLRALATEGTEQALTLPQEYLGTLDYNDNNDHKKMIALLIDPSENEMDDLQKYLENMYCSIPDKLHLHKNSNGAERRCEKFYQSMLYCLVCFFRSSFAQTEVCMANGRADITIRSAESNIVIEFKLDKSLDEAHNQMTNRDYASLFNDDSKTCYEIAINIKNTDIGWVSVGVSYKKHKPTLVSPIKFQWGLVNTTT